MSFLDKEGLGKPSKSNINQQLIQSVMEQPTGTSIKLFGPRNYIRFSSTGNAFEFNGTFSICDDRGEKFAKGFFVTPIGALWPAKDLDADDIINVNGSENVSC